MSEGKKDEVRESMAAQQAEYMESQTPERVAERRRYSARCGQVIRKLLAGKALEGKLLELAIEVAGAHEEIVQKLKAGTLLGYYEMHLMTDVFLLHARLSA